MCGCTSTGLYIYIYMLAQLEHLVEASMHGGLYRKLLELQSSKGGISIYYCLYFEISGY